LGGGAVTFYDSQPMKILSVTSLALPAVKVVRFARFRDARGYFTESFRATDFEQQPDLSFVRDQRFVQANESFSRAGTIRGLHFQWDPPQGKLVRTLHGRMVDVVLDIRKQSPSLGQALMYDLTNDDEADYGEWIWVPPGFAHGTFFCDQTRIEYFCTAEYNRSCEAGISPLAPDIDWSLCDPVLKGDFDALSANGSALISEKDRAGMTLTEWLADDRSRNFT
jgi:dTDP-4-dehydrorhamnose 3,5-epimerase